MADTIKSARWHREPIWWWTVHRTQLSVFAPPQLEDDVPSYTAYFDEQAEFRGYRRVPGTKLTSEVEHTAILSFESEEPVGTVAVMTITGTVERIEHRP